MAHKATRRLADMEIKAKDCYDPADYVSVHKNYLERLRTWIREEGERNNTCTYDILGREVCQGCRCHRATPVQARESDHG